MHNQTPAETSIQDEKTVIQLIVFRAGGEEFGVKIDEVREIIKMGMITPIPESPDFIKGIINVRGEIVTAIDIKSRFSLSAKKDNESKHIIVTKIDDNLFGIIVDEVIEVLRILKKDIKLTPSYLIRTHEKYVRGIISHEGRFIILLDIKKLVSHQELTKLYRNNSIKINNKKHHKSINHK